MYRDQKHQIQASLPGLAHNISERMLRGPSNQKQSPVLGTFATIHGHSFQLMKLISFKRRNRQELYYHLKSHIQIIPIIIFITIQSFQFSKLPLFFLKKLKRIDITRYIKLVFMNPPFNYVFLIDIIKLNLMHCNLTGTDNIYYQYNI